MAAASSRDAAAKAVGFLRQGAFGFFRALSSSSSAASPAAAGTAETAKKPKRRKKKNLFEVAQFLPDWGIGYNMAKNHWEGISYKITRINLYKDGRHGKAWGIFYKGGDWRRMSLPAMLLGETIAEILQTSQMAKQVVAAATQPAAEQPAADIPNAMRAAATAAAYPMTPVAHRHGNPATSKVACEITELKARRTKEKQPLHRPPRSESGSPPLRRARSRISFKPVSPPSRREAAGSATYRHVVAAHRVSPKNRPWAKKTVMFPNPIFSSPSNRQQKFCKTGSPVIARGRQITTTTAAPHRFLIKSPPSASKFQIRVKGSPAVSPTRLAGSRPKMAAVAKLRRSFSPSRIASRLVSPLKSRSSSRREPPPHGHGRRSAV